MTKSIQLPYSVAVGEASSDLARKAEICANVLVEARKLSRGDSLGALSNQLVARASELLDDMNELLAMLDPLRSRPSYAIVASLHRELAIIQVTMADQRRRSTSLPHPVNKR